MQVLDCPQHDGRIEGTRILKDHPALSAISTTPKGTVVEPSDASKCQIATLVAGKVLLSPGNQSDQTIILSNWFLRRVSAKSLFTTL